MPLKRNKDGLTAFDILRIPGCPLQRERPDNVKGARKDYHDLEPAAFRWYDNHGKAILEKKKGLKKKPNFFLKILKSIFG